MNTEPDLTSFRTRREGRFSFSTPVRYGDLDPNGHVNHMRYLAFLEECRLAHRRALDASLSLSPHLGWPVGGLTIRYLTSLQYPATATVETAPVRVGRTSFTLGYGIFDGEACVALAHSQTGCSDRSAGGSAPLPEPLAARLLSEMDR